MKWKLKLVLVRAISERKGQCKRGDLISPVGENQLFGYLWLQWSRLSDFELHLDRNFWISLKLAACLGIVVEDHAQDIGDWSWTFLNSWQPMLCFVYLISDMNTPTNLILYAKISSSDFSVSVTKPCQPILASWFKNMCNIYFGIYC